MRTWVAYTREQVAAVQPVVDSNSTDFKGVHVDRSRQTLSCQVVAGASLFHTVPVARSNNAPRRDYTTIHHQQQQQRVLFSRRTQRTVIITDFCNWNRPAGRLDRPRVFVRREKKKERKRERERGRVRGSGVLVLHAARGVVDCRGWR